MTDLPTTILYPEAFKRSPTAGNDGVYHWEFWEHAIDRRGIHPMDIDACVEINNHFLIAETKDPGVEIQSGQWQSLNSLMSTGLFTMIHQIGKRHPIAWEGHTFNGGKMGMQDGGLDASRKSGSLFDFIKRWAEWADNRRDWRIRLIEAAFKNTSPQMRARLYERIRQLRNENGDV